MTAGGFVLTLRSVSAGPPGRYPPVIRDLDLDLALGDVAVLLGGNGSGKTTLLRTAAGLWPPRAGEIGGVASRGFDPQRVALVLEEPSLQFVGGTVAGEIDFALENLGLSGADLRSRREEALDRVGILDLAHRDPRTLSAGEQGAALLAAALAPGPRLLVLDDPFLYLPREAGRRLWERIADLVEEGVVGAVLAATQDAELALTATRVGILHEGRLERWGRPEETLPLLPPGIEPPLGLWLEAELARAGCSLPPGGWGLSELAERIAGAGAC